jgi:hypothetical protein
MQILKTENRVYIVLSQRNIRHLLQAFERGYTQGLVRRCEDGTTLFVQVESDETHYQGRQPGPGCEVNP